MSLSSVLSTTRADNLWAWVLSPGAGRELFNLHGAGWELQGTNMSAQSLINDTRNLVHHNPSFLSSLTVNSQGCVLHCLPSGLPVFRLLACFLHFSVSLPCFLPTLLRFPDEQLVLKLITSTVSGETLGNRSSSSDPGSLTSWKAKKIDLLLMGK